MRKLYSKCLQDSNIIEAIRIVKGNSGSNTAGPDGITKERLGSKAKIMKEVKLRLRRYKKVASRTVEIPKKNGKTRQITIINLYDRIAQQCVYQVIQPLIEPKMSKNSYGFRTGISAKVPVAKLCSCINHLKFEHYTVEIDFTKCFDNIPLDKAIAQLAKMGVKDWLLLKTIKHLMWTSKRYNGIGLGQGTILGPLLCNCYLDQLDKFIECEFETVERKTQYNRAHAMHKDHWLEWMDKRGWKIHCKYYRYADDSIIICRDKNEQLEIFKRIKEFVENKLDIKINEDKTKLGDNETVKFLGFAITKTKKISIGIANEQEILKKLKAWKLRSHEELLGFLKWINGELNYYDICNNLKNFISRIIDRLWWRGAKDDKGPLKKMEGCQIYKEKSESCQGKKRKQIIFDVWKMRRNSKLSFKDYITDSWWIKARERIKKVKTYEHEFTTYAWLLYTRQKGLDKVTGRRLNIKKMVIHHIIPLGRNLKGENCISNLILIDEETHKAIHAKEDSSNPKIRWYRNKLKE